MFKKIVSSLLAIIMISSLCIIVNAEEQHYSEKQVKINYDGVVLTETVIVDKYGAVLAPVSWLEAFGLLKCQETETYYKFYYPDQEQNDTFAKRIWISKDGTHFDIRYYEDNNSWLDELSEYYDWIKGSIQSINQKSLEGLKEQWDIKEKNLENLDSEMRNSFSILSEDFSTQTQYKDELYLPISELLPLINAKITFSDMGIIYIYPNYVSLSQALYGVNIGSLVFDADDIVGKDFISATSLVLDTVFNFRFDRLDFVNKNGVQTDYQELFKNLLVDDDTFLSLYDKETTPHDEALKYYIYQCDDLGNRVDLLKCLRTALDDVGVAKELYPDVFNFLTADYSETIKVGTSDVIEGIAKTLDYQQTYNNQIDDHRKMLGAVYGYESTNSPAKQAAYTVQALYGEKYADKLLAAVETGLRDFICVDLPKDAVSKVVAPYSIALTITKLIKPDEFETIHDFSLLDIMDETAETSYDVYISRKFSGKFDTKSLDDLRLSALMTLVSSRYAYSTMYDGQHENIDKIDEVLKKIYLSADGVECDSSDYYVAKVKDLKGKISKLDLSAGIQVQYLTNIQTDGVVLTSFMMENKKYRGIINAKGEIFYYSEEYFDVISIGKGFGYITEANKHGIIDYKTGKIEWLDNNKFDKVIGYGDGKLLTYKSNSTISVSEHIYCVIDVATGNTVNKNISPKKMQHPYTNGKKVQYDYTHIGDGWFLSMAENYGVSEDSWLYDSNTNVSYRLDKSISVVGDSFVNGKLYMTTSSYTADILRRNSDGTGTYLNFPSSIEWHFSFDQSGNVEKVSPFTAGATGVCVIYKDVEYLTIIDTATQTTTQYKDFPAKMIDFVGVHEDYCLVFIEGADYKDYFTLINKKGEQLFDPIRYRNTGFGYSCVKLSEDRIIYQTESPSSNLFDICKIFGLSGKKLFSIDYIDSDETVEFYNGITVNEEKIIDKFGNELTITVK